MGYIRLYILGVLFIAIVSISSGQQNRIDSLKALVKTTSDPETKYQLCNAYKKSQQYDSAIYYGNRLLSEVQNKKDTTSRKLTIDCYNLIGFSFEMNGNTDTAITFYQQAQDLSKKYGFLNKLSKSYDNKAYLFYGIGEMDSSIFYFESKMKVEEQLGNRAAVGQCLNDLGVIVMQQGNIEQSLDYYYQYLKICEELENTKGLATVYHNIGYIHLEQNDYEQALIDFRKSLELDSILGNKEGVASTRNKLGMTYKSISEEVKDSLERWKYQELAINQYQIALDLYTEINHKNGIVYGLNNIGVIHGERGDKRLELDYYFKSEKLLKQTNQQDQLSILYLNIGNTYLDLEMMDSAKYYADISYDIAYKLGFPDNIKRVSLLLYKIYKKQGEKGKALEMYETYIQMRDSITNVKNKKLAIRQEAKYEYEKQKAIDDKENEKRIAVEKEKQKKQFVILIFTICGAAIVAILLLIIYRRLQITRKQKVIIEEQKEEVEAQRDEIERQKMIVDEKNKEITSSINYAQRIQNAILANTDTWNTIGKDRFILYKPRDIVSGDFYWAYSDEQHSIWVAADCTGHGVPGAFMSMLGMGFLHQIVTENQVFEPDQILNRLRSKIIGSLEQKYADTQQQDGMDMALCSLNKKTGKLYFSGANNPLYRVRKGEIEIFAADKMPVGKYSETEEKPFSKIEVDYQTGDLIYIFSDGFADQFGGSKGKKLGYKKFREELIEVSALEPTEQQKQLSEFFEAWKGNEEQLDDVCLIGVVL